MTERKTLFVIRTQPNDSSARSALLSIGLICRIAVALNFFVALARSLTREFIASCKRARNIRIFTLRDERGRN